MNKMHMTLLLILMLPLAACQHEDVSVDSGSVVLHPSGVRNATISADGRFSVGQKVIDLSDDQQTLFAQYHDAVVAGHRDRDALKNNGKAMALQGLHLAGNQLRNAVAHSGSNAQKDKTIAATMHAKGKSMEKLGHDLCHAVRQLERVQSKLAKQVSAFKPYANIDAAAQVNCGSWDTESKS